MTVEFDPSADVDDRDPEVIANGAYSHRGMPFRSERYTVRVGWSGQITFRRQGPLLKKDGTPRADNLQGSVTIPEADVPLYVKERWHEEVVIRAGRAHDQINLWVDRAIDVVARGVTHTAPSD